MRYVVVDNSGSMQNMDGQRLVQLSNGQFKPIQASRWAELGDLVMEMAEVASALGAATSFHMLNPTPIGQFFVIGESKGGDNHGGAETAVGRAGVPVDLSTLKEAMGTSPNSTTPLTESVEAIIRLITPAAAALRAHGQKCVVVLATDGLPNNPDSFLRALQELQQLPVWLVVRLCTDEDAVVEYCACTAFQPGPCSVPGFVPLLTARVFESQGTTLTASLRRRSKRSTTWRARRRRSHASTRG